MTADPLAVSTVWTTLSGPEAAESLVRRLVEERLAACGSVLPAARSIFRWEGRVQREAETVVMLKTSEDRVGALLERAAELHPYDVPELLVIPVLEGHPPYLRWVVEECRPESDANEEAEGQR